MAIKKIAFNASEHEKVCRRIMGARYNRDLFLEIQRWIDGQGGGGHRYAHGHDSSSEEYVRKTWGEVGVEMFKIHVLADRVQDDLAEIISARMKSITEGARLFPYFETDSSGEDPHCKREASYFQPQGGADPNAKILGVIDVKKCLNCGGSEGLTLVGWQRDGTLCKTCLERRGIEVCSKCTALFASTLGKPNRHGSRISPNMCPACQ